MKRFFYVSLLTFVLPALVLAQLSGALSGTLGPGTFTVVGDISVSGGEALVIQPGTTLEFNTGLNFTIDGYIDARGTAADSVRFVPAAGSYGWGGLDFNDSAVDSSRLEFCLITGSNSSGIFFDGVSPAVTNCAISGNQSGSNGGGINCYNGAQPELRGCVIEENSASIIGGGLRATAHMIFQDCIFRGNSAFKGGGAYCEDAEFFRCLVQGNSSGTDGGGVYFADAANIDSCFFLRNTAGDEGAGFYLSSGAQVRNTAVDSNTAVGGGGGVFCLTATASIAGCSFSGNTSASGNGGGIYAESDADILGCQLEGNTALYGGGIYTGGSPEVDSCGFSGNTALFKGGGFYSPDGSPEVTECWFIGNSAEEGGGVWTEHGAYQFCWFEQNSASRAGGGMYFTSTLNVLNCLFIENSAAYGGGVAISAYQQNVNNCTFYRNHADTSGGGLYRDGGFYRPNANNSIIWDNTPDDVGGDIRVRYCAVSDTSVAGIGNIYDDPLFVDAASGDFHLQSTVGSWHYGQWLPDPAHSPGIDAGNPISQYGNEPLPNGDCINIGSYGNTEQASLSLPSGVDDLVKGANPDFRLYPAHPNPFNASTALSYQLQAASNVKLAIYDIAGREAAVLVDGFKPAGRHSMLFNAANLPSGVYFARLTAGDCEGVEKLLLVK